MRSPFLHLDRTDGSPIHLQIERAVRAAVSTGHLAPGVQLPTVRRLAVELKVNVNTVARAYSQLRRDGWLETRRGLGCFIATTPREPFHHRGHRPVLRDFAARVLEDAAARGFSRQEFLDQLHLLLKEEQGGEADG